MKPAGERKAEAFQASRDAWEVGMPATSGLDKPTDRVTGLGLGSKAGPAPCGDGLDYQPRQWGAIEDG